MVHALGVPVASELRFRPVVCITGILLHAVCSAPAVQAYCAYVTNIRSGNVSVIDTAKREVVDTITVDTHPAGVVVTPDGRSAYVANNDADPGDYHVCVIDTYKNIMTTTIPVGSPGNPPFGVALTPDGGSAYVTIPRGNAVSVIDTTKNQVTATVSVGVGPFGVAVTPDGRFAYVANGQDLLTSTPGNVSVIDTAIALTDPEHAVVATIPVGNTPLGVAIAPDGGFAYVANGQDEQTPTPGDVSRIDTTKALTDPGHAVVKTIPVGNNPAGVAITPDGRWAYVTNSQGLRGTLPTTGDVSVIDTKDDAVDTVQVGNNPFGVAITPDGRFAYVANSQGVAGSDAPAVPGDVSVIDTGTHAVLKTIPVGNNPVGIAISSLPMCVDGHPTCVGDCGVDREVTVDEILTLVNIALGNAQSSACRAGDANGDGQVTVDEILTAVNNALNACR
jgi:YVTN family beta-propeller protein